MAPTLEEMLAIVTAAEPDTDEEEGDYEMWEFEDVDEYMIPTDELGKERQRLARVLDSGELIHVGDKVGDKVEWKDEREKRRHELAKTGQDLEDVEEAEKEEDEKEDKDFNNLIEAFAYILTT